MTASVQLSTYDSVSVIHLIMQSIAYWNDGLVCRHHMSTTQTSMSESYWSFRGYFPCLMCFSKTKTRKVKLVFRKLTILSTWTSCSYSVCSLLQTYLPKLLLISACTNQFLRDLLLWKENSCQALNPDSCLHPT